MIYVRALQELHQLVSKEGQNAKLVSSLQDQITELSAANLELTSKLNASLPRTEALQAIDSMQGANSKLAEVKCSGYVIRDTCAHWRLLAS